MTDIPSFAKLVPGFDFLQGLVKNAGAALPSMGQWIAPTLNPEELQKRIDELRTVQFWLEQNAKMLGATIQALEVQRMTLSTLQTMNVQMTDLRDASEDDEARLLTERRVLRAALVDLRAAAALTTDHTVQTGRTVAEEWEASGMLARRELLRAALDSVTVAPSVHGHRFDPSRVTLVWRP